MDLWIRSKDKNGFYNVKQIKINGLDITCLNGELLGTYKTKKRALEVLDEIQNAILGIICNEDVEKQGIKKYTGTAILSKNSNNIVYEMPKE